MTRFPALRQSPSRFFFGILALSCLLLSSCGLLGTAASVGMIKLRFGCLVEGSLIDTPSGPIPIEDLSTGDLVIGYQGSPVTVQQIHQYQEDPTRAQHLTITFSNGAELQLSPRHRIHGIPAGQLVQGDRIEGHQVTGTRPLRGVSRTFDLLTTDQGYQIHGIPVNSMIEEMAAQ